MKRINTKESGFTIIEVVLVLAIAGLIFLVVFLALPQLQRSQRDSARQSDVGRLISAITTYASNEGSGLPPANAADVTTDVIGGNYLEDWQYEVVDGVATDTALDGGSGPNGEIVAYTVAEDCTGATTNNRSFAVYIPQENGGSFCREG